MKILLKNILILFTCLLPFIGSGQENLVLNGDLEDVFVDGKFSNGANARNLHKAKYWDPIGTSIPYKSINSTPDLITYNRISGGIPLDRLTGDYYLQVKQGVDEKYNFIITENSRVKLKKPLKIGKMYKVSFVIAERSNARNDRNYSDGLGLLFMTKHYTEENTYKSSDFFSNSNSTARFRVPTPITNTNWEKFEWTFKADSTYNFMVVGNFWKKEEVTYYIGSNGIPITGHWVMDNFELYRMYDSITLPNDTVLCKEQQFITYNQDTAAVRWYLNGTKMDSTQSFTFHAMEGVNTIVGEVDGNKDTQIVTVLSKPLYDLTMELPCLSQGKAGKVAAVFKESSIKYVFWDENGGKTEDSPLVIFKEQNAIIEYTNENNCYWKDTFLVKEKCDSFLNKIYFPTAFSPNNDGKNDNYTINLPAGTTGSLTIFNRWGEEIHKSSVLDNTLQWDGTFMNNSCQNGSYLATIVVKIPSQLGYDIVVKNVMVLLLR